MTQPVAVLVATAATLALVVAPAVEATHQAVRLEARFNPFDPRTPRGTRVDFTDGVPRDLPEAFAATLARYVAK